MKKIYKIFLLSLFLLAPYFAAAQLKHFAPGRGAGAMMLSGKYLYAVLSGSLCTFDVSQPDVPKLISRTPAFGNRQMVRHGNYLYLSCRSSGVQVFSIKNPAKPEMVNRFFPVELATGLAVSGNVLAVAQRIYGVEFFDISDPCNVVSLALLRTGEAQSVCFFGEGKIAIGDWGARKAVIGNVEDLFKPEIIVRIPLGGLGDGVAVQGKYLYAATGYDPTSKEGKGHGLEIFDISDVKNIVRKGVVRFNALKNGVPDWWSVRVSGNTAFVADTDNGVYVVDVTDKNNPAVVKHVKLPKDAASQLAVGDKVVYVSGHRTGLYCFKDERAAVIPPEFAEIELPKGKKSPPPTVRGLRNIPLPGFVWSLAKWESTLFAACGADGLKEFSIAQDGTLELQKTYHGTAMDCAVSENLLIIAADSKLKIFDRQSGRLLSAAPAVNNLPFLQIRLYGNVLCTSNRSGWLAMWDIADPEHPKRMGQFTGGGILYDDMLPERAVNGMFPVNWHSAYPRWYNSSFKETASLSDHRRCSHQSNGITEIGGKFYLLARKGVICLSPDNPLQTVTYPMVPLRAGIPTSDGNIIAVSDRKTGRIYFYKFDGKAFTSIGKRDKNLGFAVTGRVIFHNKKAYIPAGHCGIYFEE